MKHLARYLDTQFIFVALRPSKHGYSMCTVQKLVEETIVGHTSASLLNKFVPDYSQSTEYIQFDNPLYIKLRQDVRTVPSITVEIADSLGRNLILPGNTLIVPKVTLNFTCLQNG